MYPDSPFAHPVGSFQRPVTPPLVDPDSAPTQTITISCAWLSYIRGALKQLLLQSTWRTDVPGDLLLAQQRAFNLINLFVECSGIVPIACPFDFRGTSNGGWTNHSESGFCFPAIFGTFTGFVGWEATDGDCGTHSQRAIEIEKTFSPPITVDFVEVIFDLHKGSGTNFDYNYIQLFSGSTLVAQAFQDWRTFPDGSNITFQLSGGPWTIDRVFLALRADEVAPVGSVNGDLTLTDWVYELLGGSCQ